PPLLLLIPSTPECLQNTHCNIPTHSPFPPPERRVEPPGVFLCADFSLRRRGRGRRRRTSGLRRRRSKERLVQHNRRHHEIDNQPRHIHQRRHEWRGTRRRIKPQFPQ